MKGQKSTNGDSNARQEESCEDSNNCMNQSSPMLETRASSSTPLEQEQTQTNIGDGTTTRRKKKLSSDVWNRFEKMMVNGVKKTECNHCKKKLRGNSKNRTTHLHYHLKSCPRRGCRDIRQQVLGMRQKNGRLLEKNQGKIAITTDMWTSSITFELDHYLQEKVWKENTNLDILSWWKSNGFKYPTLQKIARDKLAISISTVASESAFSTSGRL
ncbi:hypothetical protein OSB04_028049, partial [Centaurea solstitialis]